MLRASGSALPYHFHTGQLPFCKCVQGLQEHRLDPFQYHCWRGGEVHCCRRLLAVTVHVQPWHEHPTIRSAMRDSNLFLPKIWSRSTLTSAIRGCGFRKWQDSQTRAFSTHVSLCSALSAIVTSLHRCDQRRHCGICALYTKHNSCENCRSPEHSPVSAIDLRDHPAAALACSHAMLPRI